LFIQPLASQNGKTAKSSYKKVDMGILVGCSDDLGKANAVASITQLFLPEVLELILSRSQDLVLLASDILEIIVMQGLGHPLSVF
jgi:hypothetical protein